MRTRLTLAVGSVASLLLAFLLGTAGQSSEADAESRSPDSPRRRLGTRTHPPRADAPSRPPPQLPTVAVAVELSRNPSDAILPPSLLMPEWDPELAWPLPDALPDDPVVFALQELLSTDADTDAHDDALDALDLALVDGPTPEDPWAFIARLEGERQLACASYHDALIDHEQRLVEWAARGGPGPRPDAPQAWKADGLADDALDLAQAIDAFSEDPHAADIARLTAAAVLLDWESGEFDENIAVDAIFDVVHHTSDPATLAAATDLLVGTTVELSDPELAELKALSAHLPGPTATRLAWFLAGRHLAENRPEDALAVLDHGIEASASYEADTLDTMWARAALEAGRGAVVGMSGRTGGRSLHESVQAAAWSCWATLIEADDPWVADGTLYRAHAIVTPGGLQWVDWTDDNAHGRCLAASADTLVLPDEPVQLWIEVEPIGS